MLKSIPLSPSRWTDCLLVTKTLWQASEQVKLTVSHFVENKIGLILSISFSKPLSFFFVLLHTPEDMMVIGYICLLCQMSEKFFSDAVACSEPLVVSVQLRLPSEPAGVCVSTCRSCPCLPGTVRACCYCCLISMTDLFSSAWLQWLFLVFYPYWCH